MPFGVSSPSRRIAKSKYPVEKLVGCICGVCGKDETRNLTDDWFPLVPVVIPKEPNGLHEQRMVFICPTCYAARNRKDFQCLEDFKRYRSGSKRGPKSLEIRDSKSMLEVKLDEALMHIKAMHAYLVSQGMTPVEIKGAMEVFDEPSKSNDFDDDDLEFGMTDEQRRRMDEAVAKADARTREVPKEEWNFENEL